MSSVINKLCHAQALALLFYVWYAMRFRYKEVVHETFEPEALALGPMPISAFSIAMTRSESG